MSRGWWAAKVRRTRFYLRPSIRADERDALAAWLTPAELALFDSMPAGDRRHGLEVVACLRSNVGSDDRDLLVAGLLHDCGKGPRVRLLHRIVWSLSRRYGRWIGGLARPLPTFGYGLARLRDHAALSAELAEKAGCGARTVELIRNQETPIDDAGRLLLAADEDN